MNPVKVLLGVLGIADRWHLTGTLFAATLLLPICLAVIADWRVRRTD